MVVTATRKIITVIRGKNTSCYEESCYEMLMVVDDTLKAENHKFFIIFSLMMIQEYLMPNHIDF